jgi:O-antigen/teichoic acid export membrane protein
MPNNPRRIRRGFSWPASRAPHLIKETLVAVSGQVTSILGTLVLIRILTETLDPLNYGSLALALTGVSLVNQVLMGSLNQGLTRYYPIANEDQDIAGYLAASRKLVASVLGTACFVMLLGLVGAAAVRGTAQIDQLIAISVLAIVAGCSSAAMAIHLGARRRSIVAIHSALDPWLKIAALAVVLPTLGKEATPVLVAMTLSTTILLVSQWLLLPRVGSSQISTRDWSLEIRRFSMPFVAWGLFSWLQQASDRWLLEMFSTRADVGIYAVVFQVGFAPMLLISTGLSQIAAPILYQMVGDATQKTRVAAADRVSVILAVSVVGGTLVGFVTTYTLHSFIFRVLVAEEYRAHSNLLPWMVLAGGLMASYHTVGARLANMMTTRKAIIPVIISSIGSVTFNFLGAFFAGLQGVIAALVVGSLLHVVVMAYTTTATMRKHHRTPTSRNV